MRPRRPQGFAESAAPKALESNFYASLAKVQTEAEQARAVPPPKVDNTPEYKSPNPVHEKIWERTEAGVPRDTRTISQKINEWRRAAFVPSAKLKGSEIIGAEGESRTRLHAMTIDDRRVAKTYHRTAIEEATQQLRNVFAGLTRNDYNLLRRVVDADQKFEALQRGEVAEPGVSLASWDTERQRVHTAMQAAPRVAAAYSRHLELMRAVGQELARRGLIPQENLRQYYYPHSLLDFTQDRKIGGVPTGPGLSRGRIGATKARSGRSVRDINRDYITVVGQYLTDVFEMMKKHDLVNQIGLREHLTVSKRADAMQYRDKFMAAKIKEPPPGWTAYNLNSGFAKFRGTTVSERLLDEMIDDNVGELAKHFALRPAELGEYLDRLRARTAPGLVDPYVVIPKEVADELRIMVEGDYIKSPIERAARVFNGAFKTIVLNKTPIQYNLRNFVGDVQRAVAQFGGEVLHPKLWQEATKEAIDAYTGKGFSDEWRWAHDLGVLSSGRTAVEIRNLSDRLPDFRKLKGKPSFGDAKALWDFLPASADMREDIGRMVIFKMNMRRAAEGKPMLTGVVDPEYVKGLLDAEPDNPVRAAAKIARSSLIDYGDFTLAEDRLRRSVIPFYAWAKGNLQFWAHDLPKAAARGAVNPKDAAGVAALKGVAATAIIVGTVRYWNSVVMQEAEEKLPEYTQNTNHLILPDPDEYQRSGKLVPWVKKDARGQERVVTVAVRDALDDAFQAFGIDGLAADIHRYMQGRISGPELKTRFTEKQGKAQLGYGIQNLGPSYNVLHAIEGVRTFPDPLNPQIVPPEEYAGNLLGSVGISGAPGVETATRTVDPLGNTQPGKGVAAQFGYREIATLPHATYVVDLQRRLLRAKREILELEGRTKTLEGGLRNKQLEPADRQAQFKSNLLRLQQMRDQIKRLRERYIAVVGSEPPEEQ